LKVDYGIHRKKYRTQFQMDEDERKRKLDELRNNATTLREERNEERRNGRDDEKL